MTGSIVDAVEPNLPFACPRCGMRSVAVGICPDCRVPLATRALAPSAGPQAPSPGPQTGDLPDLAPVFQGHPRECEEMVRILASSGIETWVDGAGRVLVPARLCELAEAALASVWEKAAQDQGLDPVTPGEAMALEARGLCPACGDPILPGAQACPSCGIALA